jgi:hypothetical protein
MQVEEKNLWENVTRNASRDKSSMAIAAYQAFMPQTGSSVGIQQESFEKTAGISEMGSIDMATYENPSRSGATDTVAEEFAKQDATSADSRKNEMAVIANTTSVEDL